MTKWTYFALVQLPPTAAPPFAISSTAIGDGRNHRIFASRPMTQLEAQLLRWRIASTHQCIARAEVVYSPVDDPFQTGGK